MEMRVTSIAAGSIPPDAAPRSSVPLPVSGRPDVRHSRYWWSPGSAARGRRDVESCRRPAFARCPRVPEDKFRQRRSRFRSRPGRQPQALGCGPAAHKPPPYPAADCDASKARAPQPLPAAPAVTTPPASGHRPGSGRAPTALQPLLEFGDTGTGVADDGAVRECWLPEDRAVAGQQRVGRIRMSIVPMHGTAAGLLVRHADVNSEPLQHVQGRLRGGGL